MRRAWWIPACLALAGPAPQVSPGASLSYLGDPEAAPRLDEPLQGALRSTEAFGPWPPGPWGLHLHTEAAGFERTTGAPPARAAAWVGPTLHLRPWDQLRRRDLGALLRHEVVHRRLEQAGLRPWEEEARCLWAEGHVRPPEAWPPAPPPGLQDRLDRALRRGSTREQAWAYRALRAWLAAEPLPPLPEGARRGDGDWRDEATPTEAQAEPGVTVVWPPEHLPWKLVANGHVLSTGRTWRFTGRTRFQGAPFRTLEGPVEAAWTGAGWQVRWQVPAPLWVAAATAGELGEDAPFEARRALAAVLHAWLRGHARGNHPDGTLCPLTHCAVVRGLPSASTLKAAATAPVLDLPASRALFCGSQGGHALSPREVLGGGWGEAPHAITVPGDRWATWERRLDPEQVQLLKRTVRPGLKPGQRGLHLGPSGPYPVEDLRLAAGRAFGWTTWPSNACEAELLEDGALRLRGFGWGHNAGLCLATALHRARAGWRAEAILAEAFPAPRDPAGGDGFR